MIFKSVSGATACVNEITELEQHLLSNLLQQLIVENFG